MGVLPLWKTFRCCAATCKAEGREGEGAAGDRLEIPRLGNGATLSQGFRYLPHFLVTEREVMLLLNSTARASPAKNILHALHRTSVFSL